MGIVKRPTVKQVFTIHDSPYALLDQNLSVGLFLLWFIDVHDFTDGSRILGNWDVFIVFVERF